MAMMVNVSGRNNGKIPAKVPLITSPPPPPPRSGRCEIRHHQHRICAPRQRHHFASTTSETTHVSTIWREALEAEHAEDAQRRRLSQPTTWEAHCSTNAIVSGATFNRRRLLSVEIQFVGVAVAPEDVATRGVIQRGFFKDRSVAQAQGQSSHLAVHLRNIETALRLAGAR
jgi:hypothetical protein